MKRFVAFCSSVALITTSLVVGLGPAAGAATLTLPCSADAPVVGAQPFTQDINVTTSAPASVAPGATFTQAISVSSVIPSSVSTSAGNVTINSIRSFVLKIPPPANATYVSSSLTGSGGTASFEGGNVVVRVAGPVAGGATATFPTLNLTVTATGAIGSTVEPHLGGSSIADPALTFTINANVPILGNSDISAACSPPAGNPALGSTAIAADTAAPSVSVVAPANGGSYLLGAVVPAQYSCSDEQYGSGLASCIGTVANGSGIDTSALGAKSFSVTGTDGAGNPTTVNRSYNVVAPAGDQTPPSITITTPPDGAVYRQGQAVPASFSCSDVSGVQSCTGTVSNGSLIDTATPGGKTFAVSAIDNAGNPAKVVRSYRVLAGAATTIGPFNAGTITGGAVNLDGTVATIKVTAPASNGGQVKIGDTFTIDWSIYRARRGVGYTSNWGPDPLNWTLPAPSNAVIDGPVLVDENGLNGETHSNAHQGSNPTGLKSIEPSASPSNASQIIVHFDDNSVPAAIPIQDGDGVLVHVRYNVRVTTLGAVTVPGFPQLTGTDCGAFGAGCTSITTDNGVNPPGISFTAIDVTPPTIAFSSPGHGALYAAGTTVNAAFTCSDDSGVVASCIGDVANGQPVPTGVSGPVQLHVTATDNAGNVTERWVTYSVTAPTVSASTCTGIELGTCTFALTLSNPSQRTVTVDYSTAPGTATAADYVSASGGATFAPGSTSRNVSITLSDDALDEPDETFTLSLGNASNAYLGVNGVGTIQDGSPTFTAHYDASYLPTLQAAAAVYNIPMADITKIGVTLIAFLTSLNPNTPAPLATPPNNGTLDISASYTQADGVLVNQVATRLGLANGDDLHWYGGYIVGFFYLISH